MNKTADRKSEKRIIRVVGVVLSVTVVVAISFAAQVPNSFVANTVASASEVNQNFKYLTDRSWELAAGGSLHHTGNIGIGNSNPTEKLEITGNAKVSGDLAVGGYVKGKGVQYRKCAGGLYTCNPRDCMNLCQANGERMATYDEVFAWTSGGNNHCTAVWILHPTLGGACKGIPMYINTTSTGCGPANTGDVPRITGCTAKVGWDDTAKADCACHTLQ
jgi:hypothetical protein